VDVEWQAAFGDLIEANRARVVVSWHDFAGVPADLASRARAMRGTGAAVIKVAITPTRLSDTLALRAVGEEGNAVVVGMGDAGVPSRVLASRFGSRWTYGGNAVAPGQIPSRTMLDRFRFRDIGPRTAVYGVVGHNVMHSMSPIMHNAAFAVAGIDAVYVPFCAADFDDFRTFADAMDVAGASVTIPFKIEALRASAGADDLTRAVGAANTLRRGDGGWEATNTDVAGFMDPLETLARDHGLRISALRCAVLGAGGVARAAVASLTSRGASVTVHARRPEQAREVADGFGAGVGAWPPPPASWDVLVNCTPLGSASARGQSPLPGGPFEGRVVYDLTYGPDESLLVSEARRAGCLALDGLPMLIAQAERQFEWWTGRRPAPGVMRDAARLT
jgi:3-dehydroquinate dehydratase/shikimate dehydrogenase